MSALRRNIWSRLGWEAPPFCSLGRKPRAGKPLRQEGRASKRCWFSGLEELIIDRRRRASVAVAGFAGVAGGADAAVLLPRAWPADARGYLPCALATGSRANLLVPTPARTGARQPAVGPLLRWGSMRHSLGCWHPEISLCETCVPLSWHCNSCAEGHGWGSWKRNVGWTNGQWGWGWWGESVPREAGPRERAQSWPSQTEEGARLWPASQANPI